MVTCPGNSPGPAHRTASRYPALPNLNTTLPDPPARVDSDLPARVDGDLPHLPAGLPDSSGW